MLSMSTGLPVKMVVSLLIISNSGCTNPSYYNRIRKEVVRMVARG